MINPKPSLQNLTVQGKMLDIAHVYIAKIVAYYENKMKTTRIGEWRKVPREYHEGYWPYVQINM